MSSNPLHISRANYEEFFLLYIDDELAAEERAAVDAFCALHPDLAEELDMLRDTTLDVPSLSFGNTDALLSSAMSLNVVDENLLLYIDNELDSDARKVVELELAANASFRAQHVSLLQTKLDPSDTVVFPGKSSLYRREEDRRRPLFWLRIAAAVVIAAGVGSILAPAGEQVAAPPTVALTKPAASTPGVSIPSSQPSTTVTMPEPAAAEDRLSAGSSMAALGMARPATAPSSNRMQLPVTRPDEGIAINNAATTTDVPTDALAARLDNAVSATTTLSPSQQILNSDPVTSSPTAALNMQNTADSRADNGKQGSVRGLLRKATRFIERRTGIKSTDDDDRLLVGAVAIPLN
ncbi:MAG: hypothetical protein JWP27_2258 [Flaviaesturariibacter sp.]|nr:hypothetical protein [Flaviaesturariibacter sp.]